MEPVEKGRTKGIIHGRGCALCSEQLRIMFASGCMALKPNSCTLLSASVWVGLFGCEPKIDNKKKGKQISSLILDHFSFFSNQVLYILFVRRVQANRWWYYFPKPHFLNDII